MSDVTTYSVSKESQKNQKSVSSGTVAGVTIAIALVVLLVVISCILLVVIKRRKQQDNNHPHSVLQLDGPHGNAVDTVITSEPREDTNTYEGVSYTKTNVSSDGPNTPPEDNDDIYHDIRDSRNPKPENSDDIYHDIGDSPNTKPDKNGDDIYHDIRDKAGDYANASVNHEKQLVKEPGDDGGLVPIYAKSQYGGRPRSDGNQQEGWVDNDIYATSDEDQQKRQTGGNSKQEGWVDNSIYATTDE